MSSPGHTPLHSIIHFFFRSSYSFIRLLFIHFSFHPTIQLFIQTSTSSSDNLPIYLFISLFIQPSLFSSNHPPLHPNIHLFIPTSISSSKHPLLHPSIFLFIHSSPASSNHLSFHPTIHLFIQSSSTSSSKHPPFYQIAHSAIWPLTYHPRHLSSTFSALSQFLHPIIRRSHSSSSSYHSIILWFILPQLPFKVTVGENRPSGNITVIISISLIPLSHQCRFFYRNARITVQSYAFVG